MWTSFGSSRISYTNKKSRFKILLFRHASFVRCAFQLFIVGVGWTSGGRNGVIRRRPFVHMLGECCSMLSSSAPFSTSHFPRHLTLLGPLDKDGDLVYIETLFSKFPYLASIALEELDGRITWAILKACLLLPHLASLSVHLGLYTLSTPPFPQDDVAITPISLKHFSYATTMWREKMNGVEYVRGGPSLKVMRADYDFECECLSGIVLRLNDTVTSLSLPIESAPILAMAELPWPHLRDLSLHGRLIDAVHATSLQHLLQSLWSLRKLSILAGRFSHRPVRHPILPGSSIPPSGPLQRMKSTPALPPLDSSSVRSSAVSNMVDPPALLEREPSPFPLLQELRSLTIAYPDPEDGLFSLSLPHLIHLSLRDQPRVYHRLTGNDTPPIADGPYGGTWPAPLLSPEECLSILRRMDLSSLTSLELAYMASTSSSDDDLLSYIAESVPHLEHLELHRYRGVKPRTRTAQVDHVRPPISLSVTRAYSLLGLQHRCTSLGCYPQRRPCAPSASTWTSTTTTRRTVAADGSGTSGSPSSRRAGSRSST